MVSPSQIRESGILIRPGEVPDIIRHGLRTKQLISPATGSALTGCQVIYHQPGETYRIHAHPVSEDVTIVFKGRGEAWLGDCWYEVIEGDVIYAPENVRHGTRNPAGAAETFICYNWQVPYLDEYDRLPGAEDEPESAPAHELDDGAEESPAPPSPPPIPLEESPDTRLVVVGNSAFLSDLVARSLGQIEGGFFVENLRFVENLIDWVSLDSDMMKIRSRGLVSRRLNAGWQAALPESR